MTKTKKAKERNKAGGGGGGGSSSNDSEINAKEVQVTVVPSVRFYRFLLYADTGNLFAPGCRMQKKFYDEESLKSFRELLYSLEKDEVFEIIRKVWAQKPLPYPEVTIFVLTECCRSSKWRTEALQLAHEICNTSEYFLLFFKFGFEITPKLGSGRAIKRFISDWYHNKEILDLIELIGETPKYRGWHHRDLLRIGHVKGKTPAFIALFNFLAGDPDKCPVKEEEDAKTIVSYFSKIYNFRKQSDVDEVCRTIESYMLSVKHLNMLHRKKKKVWKALLPKMAMDDIIEKLHLFSRWGLLSSSVSDPESSFMNILFERLSNITCITESKTNPVRIGLELLRYQYEPKLKMSQAKKAKKLPVVSKPYVNALEQLMDTTLNLIESKGYTVSVYIDSFKITDRKCKYRRYVDCVNAASILALALKNTSDKGTIAIFNGEDIKELECNTVSNLNSELTSAKELDKPAVGPALKYVSKGTADVFVFISYNAKPFKFKDTIANSNPKQKFIFISLCGYKAKQYAIEGENVLFLTGFDAKMFDLINAFLKI